MIRLNPDFVSRLQERLKANHGSEVMHALGIGENSWRKLRRGQAIRASVARRLVERFGGTGDELDR
ncbi:MAG: hypothetical protein QM690_08155 [Sphingobium sp.]